MFEVKCFVLILRNVSVVLKCIEYLCNLLMLLSAFWLMVQLYPLYLQLLLNLEQNPILRNI